MLTYLYPWFMNYAEMPSPYVSVLVTGNIKSLNSVI